MMEINNTLDEARNHVQVGRGLPMKRCSHCSSLTKRKHPRTRQPMCVLCILATLAAEQIKKQPAQPAER